MKILLTEHRKTLAAVIVEPIVQGAGRMYFYHPTYLLRLEELCRELNVLLIFDEIATGFYRTGKPFAMNHASIAPDIVCLGKALTGGYLSLAATVTTENIANVIGRGEPGVFMHGPTFMGNPLACAVARESITLLKDEDAEGNVRRIANHFSNSFAGLIHPRVADTRTLGAIAVIECKEQIDLTKATPFFVSQGVWLRPFGKLLYCMPPYSTTDDELGQLSQTMIRALDQDIFNEA
jgi:adenosylmethionine---8-amino-7-oxononanoate aminotransferase